MFPLGEESQKSKQHHKRLVSKKIKLRLMEEAVNKYGLAMVINTHLIPSVSEMKPPAIGPITRPRNTARGFM